MKKLFLFFLLLLAAEVSFSQAEKKQFIQKGLLRAMATISMGGITKISLHGNLEYYIAENVSLRGDSYYSLKMFEPMWQIADPKPYLDFNHQTLAGFSYHFRTKNHFDPYFGFQPGVAISQSVTDWGMYSNQTVNPIISPLLGFNLYFEKWFHLFAETRYVIGKHLSDSYKPVSLNELRFSFGLGFNLSVFKPKGGS